VVFAKVGAREKHEEQGHVADGFLNGGGLELSAIDGATSGEVEGIDGQLNLSSNGVHVAFKKEVVVPLHRDGKTEIVEPVGTNCPKLAGRAQGACTGPEDSLEERRCSSSGLGRK
jgi:hypothetical protein